MSAAKATVTTTATIVKVTVTPPFQVNHDGQLHGPGDTLTVPVELAGKWQRMGLVAPR